MLNKRTQVKKLNIANNEVVVESDTLHLQEIRNLKGALEVRVVVKNKISINGVDTFTTRPAAGVPFDFNHELVKGDTELFFCKLCTFKNEVLIITSVSHYNDSYTKFVIYLLSPDFKSVSYKFDVLLIELAVIEDVTFSGGAFHALGHSSYSAAGLYSLIKTFLIPGASYGVRLVGDEVKKLITRMYLSFIANHHAISYSDEKLLLTDTVSGEIINACVVIDGSLELADEEEFFNRYIEII